MELSGSPMLIALGTGLVIMCVGGWMLWSSQAAVDAGAAWEDSPEWWAGDVRVGNSKRGNRSMNDGVLVLDTNGDHYNLGLLLAGLGALVALGAGVASVGMSRGTFDPSSDDHLG